jgi:capsular polysaccharide export protein
MKLNNLTRPVTLFAFSKSQNDYFTKLAGNIHQQTTVIWYKQLIFPSFIGLKSLGKTNMDKLINLKMRESRNKNPLSQNRWIPLYKIIKQIEFIWNFLLYFRVLQKNPDAVIGMWNGNKFRQSILVEVARVLQVPCSYFENGLLPNTTTMDLQGINAKNSLPRIPSFYNEQIDLSCTLPTQLVKRRDKFDREYENHLSSKELPNHFIFVPFQVNTDSQIILHSPWIKHMFELFDICEAIALKSNIHFVLKEHPSCSQIYDSLYERADKNSHLHFAPRNYSTQELIEKCDAVATINSTVGMEALIYNKKVIVLGEAFYSIEGITQTVTSTETFEKVLAQLHTWSPDKTLVERFLKYIYCQYSIPETTINASAKHYHAVTQRFKGIT